MRLEYDKGPRRHDHRPSLSTRVVSPITSCFIKAWSFGGKRFIGDALPDNNFSTFSPLAAISVL